MRIIETLLKEQTFSNSITSGKFLAREKERPLLLLDYALQKTVPEVPRTRLIA